jgi:hypothetical protein
LLGPPCSNQGILFASLQFYRQILPCILKRKKTKGEFWMPPPLVPSKAVLCQASKASAEEIELPPTTALYANFLDL